MCSHKKIAHTLCAILILLSLVILLVACNRDKGQNAETAYYLSISLEGDELEVYEDILYCPTEDEEDIVLRLYANAYAEDNNAIELLSVKIDRQTVDYEIYGKYNTVMRLDYSARAKRTALLSLHYTLALPRGNGRLGMSEDSINLSCFYPCLAVYEEGWREDEFTSLGDPFYSDIASFYVSLKASGFSLASSGSYVVENGAYEITAEHIRDFGAVLSNGNMISDSLRLEDKDVTIFYLYSSDPSPEETMMRAEEAIYTFSKAFGEYAYDVFSFAESPLDGGGGMEYGSFAIIAPAESREEYLDALTHEIAHQWWYCAVGNDQLNNAWLDEGLSEFCAVYFYLLRGDRDRFKSAMAQISRSYNEFAALKSVGFDGKMQRHLSTFLTVGEYVAVAYLKGAIMFDSLRTVVGDGKFQAALSTYYANNKFGVATADSLVSAFSRHGLKIDRFLNSFLSDKTP